MSHNGKANNQPERLQPHNVDAEEAVLGALLIDPDAIIRVNGFLRPADFFLERNAWIYEAILTLHSRREPTDLVTLSDTLDEAGRLDDLPGGSAYLTGLINATPTSIHAEFYGRIIERSAVLRRLIDGATQIAQLAYSPGETPLSDIIDRAETIIFGVTEKRIERDLRPARPLVDDLMTQVEYRIKHQGELIGIPTGIGDLDRLLGGLQKSDLVIVAGRPSMGKTSLALSIALHAAKRYHTRSALFSLEMSSEQLMLRLVSAESGIDSQGLRDGKIADDDWPVFIRACSVVGDAPLYIDDTPALSVSELRAKARRLQAERGLDLLIVDYLQLMRGDSKAGNREQEISSISRGLKQLARELRVPVLALSQLSRAVEGRHNKRPMLSDLRDSGSIEQDADVVMFVYRDEVYNADTEFPNVAELIVGKHRSGPTGMISTYFKKRLAQFVDLEVHRRAVDY